MSDDSKTKLQRFGRYLILDHLIDGGMAKICRARFLGEQVDKVVVIKMVQPQFSNDESFRTMFMDEIKVTYGLLHPNIVQTYDYGIHNDQLFVAMEYCDGRNLKEYFEKLRKRKFVFPVEISVYIMTQVCQGLHYAHTFSDKLTGEEAKIVHRDISPHNIMLTYDGSVKVIDFGIAKSETNSEATQAGTIKGKLSYLAPEYLEGHELDPRYDEFATGVTLWEMLCSRKLFKAPNDLAVLKKIQECKVPPPSSINPNVPKELDDIILKALSKDRNKRYENLDQLNRALIKFLYSTYPDFNASDLSYFAKELFKEEISKDREKLYSYGKINVAPYLEDLANEQNNGSSGAGAAVKSRANESKENEFDFGYEDASSQANNTRKHSSKGVKKEVDIEEKFGNIDGENLSVESSTRKTKDKTVTRASGSKKVKRGTTSISEKTSLNKKKKSFPLLKIASIVLLLAVGYVKFGTELLNNSGHDTVAQNEEDNSSFTDDETITETEDDESRIPTSVKDENQDESNFMDEKEGNRFGYVRLINIDKHNQNMNVYLNDNPEKLDFLGRLKVPKGKDVNIRVEEIGRVPYVRLAYNLNNDPKRELKVIMGGSLGVGTIYTSSACDQGTLYFTLFGEQRSLKVPIKPAFGQKIPGGYSEASGKTGPREYDMTFLRTGETNKYDIKFRLDENQKVDFCTLIP